MHGRLLDLAMADVTTERVLTLDSDCFPVANGWLKVLVDMADGGVSGILWPWVPPPPDLDPKNIESRVRTYHCWNNTQVACQLVRADFVRDNRLMFIRGEDTGFEILDKAHEMGLPVRGLMPTRCALPDGGFDAELNRHVCVVYGDCIYHHGGATREKDGAVLVRGPIYDGAREKVLREGAEWVLDDALSHRYVFDREEEVAQHKMEAMYEDMVRYLGTNDRLFLGGWA